MLVKYRVNTNIHSAAMHWVTDRQTDRMFWYNNTIGITILIYKVRSGEEESIIKHRLPVSTYRLTNSLSISEGLRGLRHRHSQDRRSRCSSAKCWTGTRTQQVITTTTGNVAGRNGEERQQHHHHPSRNIITTSSRNRDHRPVISKTSSRNHR